MKWRETRREERGVSEVRDIRETVDNLSLVMYGI